MHPKYESKHTESQLQESYQNHKDKIKPPSSLYDNIIHTAAQQRPSPWRWFRWQYAMAIFFIVIAVGWNKSPVAPYDDGHYTISSGYDKTQQVVYYHDIALEYTASSADKNHQAEQQYLSAIAGLKNTRKLVGVVQSIDDDMVIRVCDIGVVQLSKRVMGQLRLQESKQILVAGNSVFLFTDKNGYITAIKPDHSAQQCPS